MPHARDEVPARSTPPIKSWKLRNVGNKTFAFIPFDQQKPDDGWPESEEEQVRKFQIRRCNEDSEEKYVKDDEYERRADVRCVDVRRADVT